MPTKVAVPFRRWGHDTQIELPVPGDLKRLVWHWSAGTYEKTFEDYHFCVLGPPRDGLPVVTHNLRNNMRNVGTGGRYAAHTWRLNSFCAGLSAMAMRDAVAKKDGSYDFGPFPITAKQIECLAWLAALLHVAYAIPVKMCWTHHEAYQWHVRQGNKPPDFRWDLKVVTPNGKINGGDILRGKAAWYVENDPALLQVREAIG